MARVIRGQCSCGAVVIEITSPTEFASHCHCQSCRRAHGAALVTWTGVVDERLRLVRGEELLQRHQSSRGTFRCFCRRCGTPMLSYYTAESPSFGELAGKSYVPVAVLTDPLDRRPDSHVSFEEHVDWFEFSDGLPRFRAKTDEPITD